MPAEFPVGPPRLIDFSSQVCSKSSVSDLGNATSSCILNLKIQDNVDDVNHSVHVSDISVELSQPTLNTLLEGLGRIRDQLSTITARK